MDYNEKIGLYLDNEMSEEERLSFEKEIDENTSLQKEVGIQKEIIEGIKAVRKQELKAMLNSVPVGGGTTFSTPQIFTAALTTILIGTGIYYFYPSDNHQEDVSSGPIITLDSTKKKDDSSDNNKITQGNVTQDNSVAETKKENSTSINEEIKPDISTPSVTESDKVIEESTESIESESVKTTPAIKTPSIPNGIEEPENESDDLTVPENDLLENTPGHSTSLEIEINSNNEEFNFHYQFKDQKIHLYGSFDEQYEILDFKRNGKRALYLYFKENYYPLNTNNKVITKLEKVKTLALITELNKLRLKNN